MSDVPFTNYRVSDPLHNRHRLSVYMGFIGNDRNLGDVLDVGGESEIGNMLMSRYGKRFAYTLATDFNYSIAIPYRVEGGFDTIFCFEVIEHIMNPLFFMEQLRDYLRPGGRVYVSTPRMGILGVHIFREHFTEYKVRQLKILFEYSGFEVVRMKKYRNYPWYFLWGFRPIIRTLFFRNVVFELKRKGGV